MLQYNFLDNHRIITGNSINSKDNVVVVLEKMQQMLHATDMRCCVVNVVFNGMYILTKVHIHLQLH